ncbi:MAG: glycosyltransferase family 39 protein, partial [Candidatus Omnitrophica bacterium]|nr:glycosyltransferase family 39 protein [Candidatus Omnitrophota bacterium]
MSENFWKRLSLLAGYVALIAIFSLLSFMANIEIKDLDLWLHIGMGRYIVGHGFQVPSVDVLSCTIAGQPWVNHEWLFQLIVYFVHQWGGPEALINMQVVLVSITMGVLLILGYNKNKQLATIFLLLLVSLVYQTRFTTRPDLFSLFFFSIYILVLAFYLDRRWATYILFGIQILWTNIHGFFFLGPVFIFIALIAEWSKRHLRLPYEWNHIARLTDDEYRRLKFIFIMVILACFFNPLGVQGAWYPVRVFFELSSESKIFFQKIVELKPPITWGNIFSAENYPFYKLLILLSFISFVFNRRKIDIGVLLFWLLFLFFSLGAVRNIVFFAFAAYLAFLSNIVHLTLEDVLPIEIVDKKFVHIGSTILKIFITIWVLQFWTDISTNGYFDFDKYERKSEFGGVALRSYPYHAADFLVENQVKGNFFNDFNTGAYLVGRCSPNIKVFIDGRTEVYGPEFFKDYQKIWEQDNPEAFKEALEKYQITGILLNSVHDPIPEKILVWTQEQKDWVPVYFDHDAVIYLKDIPENQPIIEKHRQDLAHRPATPVDLFRLGVKKVIPYQSINRAFTLENLGFD